MRRERASTVAALALAAVAAAAPAAAAVEVTARGLLDLRLVDGDSEEPWLDGGLDKARFGSGDGPLEPGAALLDLVVRARPTLTAHATVAVFDRLDGAVDLTEAFLLLRPVPRSAWRLQARGGAFHPPVSLENGDVGWTSLYALTPSAINTWIGEEIRIVGAEVQATRMGRFTGSPHDVSVVLGLYRANDPAGALLSWRGWALHDRQTGLFERLPLAPLPGFEETGSFPPQEDFEEPFVELDGRTGVYGGAQWDLLDRSRLRYLRYDNLGDPTVVRDGQWVWRTRFHHLGWQARLPVGFELLAQAMSGDTWMDGFDGHLVFVDFQAAYLLLTRAAGPHRITLRWDRFRTIDEDVIPDDPNDESGHAWTLAYLRRLDGGWEVAAEVLRVESTRPAREIFGGPAGRDETTAQMSVRWRF